MKITCLYLEGCPSKAILTEHVERAVADEGVEAVIEHITVTASEGIKLGIAGSPTVLIDGNDIAGEQDASLT